MGPENTPYAYGYYLFEIEYPKDYPLNPPKFRFLTNSDKIRMNPNLYRTGKVCISILNTWKGEQWSSCQTLKTVLLTLLTVFNNKPLLNEPGYSESNDDFEPYNEIIRFQNIQIAIVKIINKEICSDVSEKFDKIITERFKQNYKSLTCVVRNEPSCKTPKITCTKIYNMSVVIDYSLIEEKLNTIASNYGIEI
jgi:ubiquitin-conjugating enzyme E2 Z